MKCQKSNRYRTMSILLVLVLLLASTALQAMSLGLRFSFGARYDNVRMCVASAAGTPGGPAADAALLFIFQDSKYGYLEFVLPVFRPIFFWQRFDMLQFEPEVTWIPSPDASWRWGLGLGVTMHYGPDYRSTNSLRGDEFWAFGPRISFLFQKKFRGDFLGGNHAIGIRPYVSPLFSSEYDTGVVLGANIEYSILW